MRGDWREEFGLGYGVPAAALAAAGLTDVSWANDACPAFEAGEGVRLYVDHPVAAEREGGGARFTVAVVDPLDRHASLTVYEGDDLGLALAAAAEAGT